MKMASDTLRSHLLLLVWLLSFISLCRNTLAVNRQADLDLAAQLADAEAEARPDYAGDSPDTPHIRRKRLIWITDDGRLALPPGTALTFTPTISLPLVRHPPEGFFSNLTISFPVTSEYLQSAVQSCDYSINSIGICPSFHS